MSRIAERLDALRATLPQGVSLVAVSKFQPLEALQEAYAAGQRLFGESRPQEMAAKAAALPGDIRWHFIGHLQTNKLKLVLPFAEMVESIDSEHLLQAVEKWAAGAGKAVQVLLEMHVAGEDSKQGFYEEELLDLFFRLSDKDLYPHVRIRGLMGMATNTDDEDIIRGDFLRISSFMDYLKEVFPEREDFDQLSIGMSSDYLLALDYAPTLVRIGSAIFGPRG